MTSTLQGKGRTKLEVDKFVDCGDGDVAVRIKPCDGSEINASIQAPTGPYLIKGWNVTTTSSAFPPTALTDRATITIRNTSLTDSFWVVNASGLSVAGAGVDKFEVPPNETINIDLNAGNPIYLVASTTVPITTWEIAST